MLQRTLELSGVLGLSSFSCRGNKTVLFGRERDQKRTDLFVCCQDCTAPDPWGSPQKRLGRGRVRKMSLFMCDVGRE